LIKRDRRLEKRDSMKDIQKEEEKEKKPDSSADIQKDNHKATKKEGVRSKKNIRNRKFISRQLKKNNPLICLKS